MKPTNNMARAALDNINKARAELGVLTNIPDIPAADLTAAYDNIRDAIQIARGLVNNLK